MAVLRGMSGSIKGQKYAINADEISIGRAPGNSIVISDEPSVSGKHCSIERRGGQFWITDHNSTNGTKLNGEVVTKAKLGSRDIICIGAVEAMLDGRDIMPAEESSSVSQADAKPRPVESRELMESGLPFGARRRAKGTWFGVVVLMGLLALLASLWLIYKLLLSG